MGDIMDMTTMSHNETQVARIRIPLALERRDVTAGKQGRHKSKDATMDDACILSRVE